MNYTQVTNAALVYADRIGDAELSSARMDSFLKVVEARINRKLNTQPMNLTIAIPGVVDQFKYDLPANWLIIRNVVVREIGAPSGTVLASINLEQLNNAIVNRSPNAYYAIQNNDIYVSPTLSDTQELFLQYTGRLTALTSTAIENPISKYNPDCYVFGLLVEISSFAKNPSDAAMWDTRFKESLEEISLQDHGATWAGVPLQTRVG